MNGFGGSFGCFLDVSIQDKLEIISRQNATILK